tara:strand:- start:240 stop:713 length:474 start_codon:yes stop_codon:yes gene_type:complete
MDPGRKNVDDTALVTTRLMLPQDANVAGNVFGGVILKNIDEAAALVAFRHARKNVVTASMDRMDFYAPVYVGDILILRVAVNYVGSTSMEIGVRVEAENRLTGESVHTGSAYLTYVALDEEGTPDSIPKVKPVTKDERRRYVEAKLRRKHRLIKRNR